MSKLYTNIQQNQKAKLDYLTSMLFAYMADGEGGLEVLKCFVSGGQNFFLLALCVCVCVCVGGGGGSGSVPQSPSVKKYDTPPINK